MEFDNIYSERIHPAYFYESDNPEKSSRSNGLYVTMPKEIFVITGIQVIQLYPFKKDPPFFFESVGMSSTLDGGNVRDLKEKVLTEENLVILRESTADFIFKLANPYNRKGEMKEYLLRNVSRRWNERDSSSKIPVF